MTSLLRDAAADSMMELAEQRAAELRDLILNAKPSEQEIVQSKIVENLALLGGQLTSEDSIKRHDSADIVLPARLEVDDAINALEEYRESQSAETTFTEVLPFRPWDGANAFQEVAKQYFGFFVGKAVYSFWGTEKPAMRSIPVAFNESRQVPWGRVAVPMLKDAYIDLSSMEDPERGPLFAMTATCLKKDQFVIQGFFNLVLAYLKKDSIYKGRAIDAGVEPNFLDLSRVDERQIVYSRDVFWQLQANIWSILQYPAQQEQYGLPLKRAVLLTGTFGTGKSETGKITAKRATESTWTFVWVRPGDDIHLAMKTARLLEPSIVFFEDVEQIADPTNATQNAMARILDLMDGINAKGSRVLVVFTTNHPDKLHKGMLRPGRLDALIEFGDLDVEGVQQLVTAIVPADLLAPEVDYTRIQQECVGYTPAFVREAIDRAKRYSLARNDGVMQTLDTEDFVLAASGLRKQHLLMEASSDATARPSIDDRLRQVAEESVARVVAARALSPQGVEQLNRVNANAKASGQPAGSIVKPGEEV